MPGSWRGAAGRRETQAPIRGRVKDAHCEAAHPADVVYVRQIRICPGLMDNDDDDGTRFL